MPGSASRGHLAAPGSHVRTRAPQPAIVALARGCDGLRNTAAPSVARDSRTTDAARFGSWSGRACNYPRCDRRAPIWGFNVIQQRNWGRPPWRRSRDPRRRMARCHDDAGSSLGRQVCRSRHSNPSRGGRRGDFSSGYRRPVKATVQRRLRDNPAAAGATESVPRHCSDVVIRSAP